MGTSVPDHVVERFSSPGAHPLAGCSAGRSDGYADPDAHGIDAHGFAAPVADTAGAEALHRLIRLHATPCPALLAHLRRDPLRGGPLALDRDDAIQAAALIDELVSDLPHRITRGAIESLTAEHASLYLHSENRVGPTESVWTDAGQRAERAASLRRWREDATPSPGHPPSHPPSHPEDHLVRQLGILAALLGQGRCGDGVRFLDQHPLRWIPAFCSRVATRCHEPFYAGVAILTNAHLDHLRDRLGAACGLPRPAEDEEDGAATRRRRWAESRFPRACIGD